MKVAEVLGSRDMTTGVVSRKALVSSGIADKITWLRGGNPVEYGARSKTAPRDCGGRCANTVTPTLSRPRDTPHSSAQERRRRRVQDIHVH